MLWWYLERIQYARFCQFIGRLLFAEKFDTYKFANYKETVPDLIKHVSTVSVRTMELVNLMEGEGYLV